MEAQEPKQVPPEKNRGGRWVTFGDEQYRVPPLAFRSVVDLQDEVEGLRGMGVKPTPQQMATMTKIVHAALSRNYPSLKPADVEDMMDIGNYQELLNAVLNVSGFVESAPGEKVAAQAVGTPPTSL